MASEATAQQEWLLELRQVSKAFSVGLGPGQRDRHLVQAVRDVSLTAGVHEFVTLIGPSGCGKSTLLKVACGLMAPDGGTVWLRGQRATQRLGQVGYMPQQDLLLPWRRLLDNIILASEIARQDLRAARQEATELLPLFGLEGFAHSYPSELSGGMRQRAALMRAFMAQQDLLLLDEPFGALDALTRRTMRTWLLQVWSRFRQTLVLVTHDVDEAILLSDRIYVLTPRPAQVAAELHIAIERPRREEQLADPRFVGYRRQILDTLGVRDDQPA
jgi:ABC-type nitrate/sulfonate/bicarbonate transport system ATPase subunit